MPAKPISNAFVIVWNGRGFAVPCEAYLCDDNGRATCGEDIECSALAAALDAGKPILSYEAFASEAEALKRAAECGADYSVKPLPAGSFFYMGETLCVVAPSPAFRVTACAYAVELARGVTIALSIAIVIAFASVGCMLNKRDADKASRVQGFRASSALVVSANKR